MKPQVSVVVPVRADRDAIVQLLAQITPDPRVEIVVANGGAPDDLAGIASGRADVQLVQSRPGRAAQMNAGAARSQGDWLLFLHADSILPGGWLEAITSLDDSAVLNGSAALKSSAGLERPIGGWFVFALDDAAWQARVIERGVSLRVRLLGLAYGDQGIFVRRRTFEAIGGFRELPLMEDVEFARRIAATGPIVQLPLPLATSSRRWRRDGWFRRSARNIALVTLYFAGVRPATLARWYSR